MPKIKAKGIRNINCRKKVIRKEINPFPMAWNKQVNIKQILPPRYREVILLKYYHGMSCKEIASQLNISVANATKLDQRSKHKLLELCKKEGIL